MCSPPSTPATGSATSPFGPIRWILICWGREWHFWCDGNGRKCSVWKPSGLWELSLHIFWQFQFQMCVCGRAHRGHRGSSSAELITVRFKTSFAGPLLVFSSFFRFHWRSCHYFWSVLWSVGNQRASDGSNRRLDVIQRGCLGQWPTVTRAV